MHDPEYEPATRTGSRSEKSRLSWAARLLLCFFASLSAQGARAVEVRLTCPAGEGGPEMVLRFQSDRLTVGEGGRTLVLDGYLEGDPADGFSLNARGTGETMMPDAAAMDTCLAEKLKVTGAAVEDQDVVAYVVNSCRLALADRSTLQRATLSYQIMATEPGSAELLINRTYLAKSAVTGAPLGYDEWPMRQCAILP